MGRDVEDSGFAVLERRSDVEPTPTRHGRRPACRRGPTRSAIASKEPPTVSVADVSTAVEPANNRLRSSPATDSGATRSTARVEPRLSSWSSQTTSVRSGIAGANDVRIRDAVSAISARLATASARAEAALASAGDVSMADRAALAASRSAVR